MLELIWVDGSRDPVVCSKSFSSPVAMDDDFCWEGDIEVGGLLVKRVLVEHLCTVEVLSGQQQVADLQLYSLLPVALKCCVVEVSTLIVSQNFLHTCKIRRIIIISP